MGKISQAAVHEAGHIIACIALGIKFDSVHIGQIWYSGGRFTSPLTCTHHGLVKMGKLADSLGHVDQRRTDNGWKNEVIKVSGFMAELLWPRNGLTKDRFFMDHQCSGDRLELDLILSDFDHIFDQSEELLQSNFKYLIKMARRFNDTLNHSFWEPELLDLCDIWVDPTDDCSRYTRHFKWAAQIKPAACPL
jgi:hypothetical protein